MAQTTISGLPAGAALTGAEVVPMDQDGETVQSTAAKIAALASSTTVINSLPQATTPVAGTESISILQGGVSKQVTIDEIGNLDIPVNNQPGNYTFAITDRGGGVRNLNVGAATYTIPPNSQVAFPVGTVITILCDAASANSLGIDPGAGVTLQQAGTANVGNRTLAKQGMATIWQFAANQWMINGAGLT